MKRITENELNNIQIMLSKGLTRTEIANIIGCGVKTVIRVENGTHALLRPHAEEKTVDLKNTTNVEQKLDAIIELLKEIKSAWG